MAGGPILALDMQSKRLADQELGLRIQRLRARRRLGRRELAEFADRSERWVWDLEHGRVRLDMETAERLALAFGVDSTIVLGLAPMPGSVANGPGAKRDHGRREQPPALSSGVGELVEWLAAATGEPVADLEWRVRERVAQLEPGAERLGVALSISRQRIARKLLAYYGDQRLGTADLTPYAFNLEGTDHVLSIVTRSDWMHRSLVLVNPTALTGVPSERCSLVDTPPVPFQWSPVLVEALERLAAVEIGARQGTGPLIVNRPLYRLLNVSISDTRLEATFGVDRFASYALTYDLLESELLRAIAGDHRCAAGPSKSTMPLRDQILGNVSTVADVSHRLCVGGPVCLLAIARPARWDRRPDFLLVVQQRSDRVLNVHRRLAVIPKAFHQHLVSARDEVSLGSTVYRELEEELFGRADVDELAGRRQPGLDPYHLERLSAPMRWLTERSAVEAECVAFGLNLLTGNYEFAVLITVSDEEFWARYGGACLPNWESVEIQAYSSADAASLRRLIDDDRWTSEGLFALTEGLRRLAEISPERVSLPRLQLTG